jgi:hypothetical protein
MVNCHLRTGGRPAGLGTDANHTHAAISNEVGTNQEGLTSLT